MRQRIGILIAGFLVLLAAAPAGLAASSAQDTPALADILKELAGYDGGIESAAVWKLRDAVWAVKDVPAARAECEARLLEFLAGRASWPAKMIVAKHLRTIGSEKAVPVLQPLLLDKDLSDAAVYALAKIPGPAVDRAFIQALPKADGPIKSSIIAVLGDRGSAEAVGALAPLLSGGKGDFSGQAALALGSIGGPEAANALAAAYSRVRPDLRPVVAASLLRCAERLRAARDERAASLLYEKLLGGEVLPSPLRTAAMIGKIHVSGERAPSILIEQLQGSDPDFQAAAVASLRDIVKPDGIGGVCDLLVSRPEDIQIQLLAALTSYPKDKTLPTILQAARGASVPVRTAAYKALEIAGDASIVPLLAEIAVRSRGVEQAAGRAALAGLKGRDVDVAVINTLADANDPALQAECLLAIGQRQIYAAKSTVIPYLSSPAPAVRIQAARALRAIGTPSDLYAALEAYLKADEDAERLEAAGTISALTQKITQADGRAAAVKARLASEKDAAAKARLIELFARIGDDSALSAVRAAIVDPDAGVVDAAARSVAAWPTAAARFDALALARSAKTETQRLLALQGFIRMTGGEKYARPEDAAAALEDASRLASRPEEKKLILALLPSFACPGSLKLAESLAADAAVQAEAKAAADKIKAKLAGK